VPLEALRADGRRYLVEQYTISYVSHGRELLPLPQLGAEPGPALVVADPDYDVLEAAVPSRPPAGTEPELLCRKPRCQK
jgi:hypothetical protein